MGLDMHLYRRSYVKNWGFMTPSERHTITIKKGEEVRGDIQPERITYIVEEIGYWRKFNALHHWFVTHVQGGDDDCMEYPINRDTLQTLLEDLKSIGGDVSLAKAVLPTQSGFFFGDTGYGEWYFSEVRRTIEMLESVLSEEGGDFYYQSSW